jgi:hypothetical protein
VNLEQSYLWFRNGLLDGAAVLLVGVYLLASARGSHPTVLVFVAFMLALASAAERFGHWLSIRIKPQVDTALIEAARAAAVALRTLAHRQELQLDSREGETLTDVLDRLSNALAKYR